MSDLIWSLILIAAAITAIIAAYMAQREARTAVAAAARAMELASSSRASRLASASSDLECSQVSTSARKSEPGTPYSCCASNLATTTGPSSSSRARVVGGH